MQLSDAQRGFCAMLDISAAHEALPFTRMVPDVHACPRLVIPRFPLTPIALPCRPPQRDPLPATPGALWHAL